MAAGDLITQNGQYEFQQLLFNGGPNLPYRMMESVDGLWGFDAKTSDVEKQLDHGRWHGVDFTEGKLITCKFSLLGSTESDVVLMVNALRQACQPQGIDVPFIWQDPGIAGKRVIYVRPRKLALPRDFDKTKGRIDGTMALDAGDPRIYGLTLNQTNLTIVNLTGQVNLTNGGWFTGGTYGKFFLSGPATNPRIANTTLGRTIALDMVVPAGQYLWVDPSIKYAALYGSTGATIDFNNYIGDAGYAIRSDNQWWVLAPGVNLMTYSRSGGATNSTITFQWQDANI